MWDALIISCIIKSLKLIMASFNQLKKIAALFDSCACGRTMIGLTDDVAFTVHGKYESLQTGFKLVVLDGSEGNTADANIPAQDQLFIYAQAWVINSAKKSCKQSRDLLTKKLQEKYGNLNFYINVFVGGPESLWTSFSGEKRYAKFLLADNDKYGHDVLIILK